MPPERIRDFEFKAMIATNKATYYVRESSIEDFVQSYNAYAMQFGLTKLSLQKRPE